MKETFYFPHDYNAAEDEKVLKLLSVLGWEGYGLYWGLIEKLASSSEAKLRLSDLEYLAFGMRTQCERITSVVREYNLFIIEGDYFWSNRLVAFFKEKEKKSAKAKESAKVRWATEAKKNAIASKNDAIKERKGKEKKGKENREREDSPAGKMNSFISSVLEKDNSYMDLIKAISRKTNLQDNKISAELDKFVSYWCELNKSGTKQRWQLQSTFEVQKRLTTWFSRASNGMGTGKARTGSII